MPRELVIVQVLWVLLVRNMLIPLEAESRLGRTVRQPNRLSILGHRASRTRSLLQSTNIWWTFVFIFQKCRCEVLWKYRRKKITWLIKWTQHGLIDFELFYRYPQASNSLPIGSPISSLKARAVLIDTETGVLNSLLGNNSLRFVCRNNTATIHWLTRRSIGRALRLSSLDIGSGLD